MWFRLSLTAPFLCLTTIGAVPSERLLQDLVDPTQHALKARDIMHLLTVRLALLCGSSAGKCRPGFQPREMQSGSFCVPCAKGMFAARGVVCTACAAGSYSLEGFAKCIACPKGRFGKGASTASSCSGVCSKGRWGGHGVTGAGSSNTAKG